MPKKPDLLTRYRETCDEVAHAFETYMGFDDEDDDDYNGHWIWREHWWLYEVSDTYWGIGDMVYVLEIKPDKQRVMDWYWYCTEECMWDDTKIKYNLRTFIALDIQEEKLLPTNE